MNCIKIGLSSLAATLIACGSNTPTTDHPSKAQPLPINQPVPKAIDDPHIKATCANIGAMIAAKSVRVIDGDTVEVIPLSGQSERIRLLGIDAPESKQDYGKQSTQTLQQCVNDAKVTIEWTEKDRYGRLLGKVIADDKDCNLNQIRQGAAWHYKYYQQGQLEYDRLAYANAEVLARDQQRGLWATNQQIAPWDFRRGLSIKYAYNETVYDLTQAQCQLGGLMSEESKKIGQTE